MPGEINRLRLGSWRELTNSIARETFATRRGVSMWTWFAGFDMWQSQNSACRDTITPVLRVCMR